MFHQPDLFSSAPMPAKTPVKALGLPDLIERIAIHSRRPRYAFLVLNLIAKAAGDGASAGPYILEGNKRIQIRDWLSDALIPIAHRDPRRRAIVSEIRGEMDRLSQIPKDPAEAEALIDREVRNRVRRSGRCNVSRAVSDLERAGLLHRHYQGYCVDHRNRGGHREAVYTLTADARAALS